MYSRMNLSESDPGAAKALFSLQKYVEQTGISPLHLHLIEIRASQINGCAYCINMHTREALKSGETGQRIFLLDAWRDVENLYSEEEKILLALTEEVTMISKQGLSDETYQKAVKHFGPAKLTQLIMVVIAINSWNRICISLLLQPDMKFPETVKQNVGLANELN